MRLTTSVVVIGLLLGASSCSSEAEAKPVSVEASTRKTLGVALLHRHGARTGPQITSAGLQWGNAVLSPVGAEMALGMGHWLRKHYEQEYTANASEWPSGGIFCAPDPTTGEIPLSTPHCIGRDYNTKQITSQSTYFERTIRTAIGMLRGMFSNDTYAVPFVNHNPSNTDFKLGYYYSWPSANMHIDEINAYNPTHDEQTLAIMTQDELDETDGAPTQLAPALKKYWPRFRMAQQRSNAFLYMYNNTAQQPDSFKKNATLNTGNLLQSSELWEGTGAFGRVYTREVGQLFTQKLAAFKGEQQDAATAGLSPLLYHYSAHDVTIYGVMAALGGITVTDMYAPLDSPYPEGSDDYNDYVSWLVPEFASVLMLDLYDDGNVSVSFARPPQVFGADYTNYSLVTSKVAQMTCIAADGTMYRSAECRLEDYVRYTDYMKPVPSFTSVDLPPQAGMAHDNYDSYSYCFTLQKDLAATGCLPTSTAIPTDPNCIAYRTVCAAFACDSPRYVLNASSFACIDNQAPSSSNKRHELMYGNGSTSASRWFYAGTIVGSLILGVVIGFTIRLGCYERGHQKAEEQRQQDAAAAGSGDGLAAGLCYGTGVGGGLGDGKGPTYIAPKADAVTESMATASSSKSSPADTHNPSTPTAPTVAQLLPAGGGRHQKSPIGSQMASIQTSPAVYGEKRGEKLRTPPPQDEGDAHVGTPTGKGPAALDRF